MPRSLLPIPLFLALFPHISVYPWKRFGVKKGAADSNLRLVDIEIVNGARPCPPSDVNDSRSEAGNTRLSQDHGIAQANSLKL